VRLRRSSSSRVCGTLCVLELLCRAPLGPLCLPADGRRQVVREWLAIWLLNCHMHLLTSGYDSPPSIVHVPHSPSPPRSCCVLFPCCRWQQVKIADFGVARMIETSGHMTAETGTYRWMAPEVIEHKPYDEKADVFSFGVVMWELLTCKVSGRVELSGAKYVGMWVFSFGVVMWELLTCKVRGRVWLWEQSMWACACSALGWSCGSCLPARCAVQGLRAAGCGRGAGLEGSATVWAYWCSASGWEFDACSSASCGARGRRCRCHAWLMWRFYPRHVCAMHATLACVWSDLYACFRCMLLPSLSRRSPTVT
jgi:hypothetical protein